MRKAAEARRAQQAAVEAHEAAGGEGPPPVVTEADWLYGTEGPPKEGEEGSSGEEADKLVTSNKWEDDQDYKAMKVAICLKTWIS